MSWVDQEFALRLVSGYSKFRRVSIMPFKLNARCPICGDSASDVNKARFWVYPSKNGDYLSIKCFNCEYSSTFSKYLKEQDEELYREYLMEKRKENMRFGGEEKPPEPEIKRAKLVIERLDFCERLDRLPVNHPIVKYVKNRMIPREQYKRLWFTTQWPALCNSVKPDTYKKEINEPRLVIPIYNKDKKIEAFQGRALRADAAQKYITIKTHDDATKIYGLDTVQEDKDIFIFEGPIDSLFINNAIAVTGGTMDPNKMPFGDKRIWVLDNEPRHSDVKKRYLDLIEKGERVVIWLNSPWHSKDINDMIVKEGATSEEIEAYLKSNITQGLMAKVQASRWFKI